MAALLATLSQWVMALLQQLGFVGKEATLVLLGLDNAGKTTLQYRLKTGKLQSFVPTERAKEETLPPTVVGGVTIRAWDLGGHAAARHLWRKYAAAADGVVFMVDAADDERLPEAQRELHALLHDFKRPATAAAAVGAAAVADTKVGAAAAAAAGADSKESPFAAGLRVPVAILVNKMDVKSALSVAEIVRGLHLPAQLAPGADGASASGGVPNLRVFPVSVFKDTGYLAAFQWLAKQIP